MMMVQGIVSNCNGQVMFCNFPVHAERKDFINSFSMRHDIDNGLLHNAIQVIFVDLTKLDAVLKKPVNEMTGMEKFSVFLKYAENPNYRDIVNNVIESEEGLTVAGEVLMSISKDERERAIFRNRRIALADRESDRITSERVGRMAVARKALRKGMSVDDVMDISSLTRAEVEGLRDSH